MKYVSHSDSIKGNNYLKNEDHFLIKEEIGLHMVCDGRGENGRGAFASQMTTDFISRVMLANKKVFLAYQANPNEELKKTITELIEHSVHKISQQILGTIASDPARRQMGTTLSMVFVLGNAVFLAHVGNSQIYLVRTDKAHLLTDDRTAAKSNSSLAVMLGAAQLPKIDLLYLEVMPGDTLLLLSDGVTSVVDNSKLISIINESRDFNIAKAIVNYSNTRNEMENATAVTIAFENTKKKSETITPQEKFATLQKIPLFSQLDYKEMTKLMEIMQLKRILKDENIVVEGDAGQDLFVIIQGSADVLIKNRFIAKLEAGDYFGEVSLIDNEPRTATVKANSNLEALVLRRKHFCQLISTEPQISVKMLWSFAQTLSARIRQASLNSISSSKDKSVIDSEVLIKLELNYD